jgi:hypothetical protein
MFLALNLGIMEVQYHFIKIAGILAISLNLEMKIASLVGFL